MPANPLLELVGHLPVPRPAGGYALGEDALRFTPRGPERSAAAAAAAITAGSAIAAVSAIAAGSATEAAAATGTAGATGTARRTQCALHCGR